MDLQHSQGCRHIWEYDYLLCNWHFCHIIQDRDQHISVVDMIYLMDNLDLGCTLVYSWVENQSYQADKYNHSDHHFFWADLNNGHMDWDHMDLLQQLVQLLKTKRIIL